MILFYSLLLLSVPWILEAALDLYDAKVRAKSDNHKRDIWALRIPLFIVSSLANCLFFPNEFIFLVQFGQSLLLAGGLFFMFFDWAMGIGLKGNPFYLNSTGDAGTSKTDFKLSNFSALTLTGIRLLILAITLIIYTQLDYTLY